jgi:hypothetical protein
MVVVNKWSLPLSSALVFFPAATSSLHFNPHFFHRLLCVLCLPFHFKVFSTSFLRQLKSCTTTVGALFQSPIVFFTGGAVYQIQFGQVSFHMAFINFIVRIMTDL